MKRRKGCFKELVLGEGQKGEANIRNCRLCSVLSTLPSVLT
jgi:hypothetical protein